MSASAGCQQTPYVMRVALPVCKNQGGWRRGLAHSHKIPCFTSNTSSIYSSPSSYLSASSSTLTAFAPTTHTQLIHCLFKIQHHGSHTTRKRPDCLTGQQRTAPTATGRDARDFITTYGFTADGCVNCPSPSSFLSCRCRVAYHLIATCIVNHFAR